MIDISADAKMLLAENRKTLFKADLILDKAAIDATGKNLDDHENGNELLLDKSFSTGNISYIGVAQGFDVSQIPRELMEKYQYIIFSLYFDTEELSNASDFTIGYLCNERRLNVRLFNRRCERKQY